MRLMPVPRRHHVTPSKARRSRTSTTSKALGVKIEPFGPTPADLQAVAGRVTKHRAVQTMMAKSRYRLLYIDVPDADDDDGKATKPKEPQRFRATLFDYTKNRTVFAVGSFATPASLEVIESGL